jgi:hypothetical protein
VEVRITSIGVPSIGCWFCTKYPEIIGFDQERTAPAVLIMPIGLLASPLVVFDAGTPTERYEMGQEDPSIGERA